MLDLQQLSQDGTLLRPPIARTPASARPERRLGEGRHPGNVRVFLASPRWGKRFLRFLELSGVGRLMADGTNEDAVRAAMLDDWMVWEAEGEVAQGVQG